MHEMKVSVKCPVCGKRICDKIPGASGRIQLKCRECDRVVWINLEYRAPVGRCFPVLVMAAGCGRRQVSLPFRPARSGDPTGLPMFLQATVSKRPTDRVN